MVLISRIRSVIRSPYLIGAVGGGALIGLLMWYVVNPMIALHYQGVALRQSSGDYTYIRPLLTCDIASQDAFTDLSSLKSSLSSIISARENRGEIDSVSVYFRSLKDAHWFDINTDETYAPASLLKIFVMMAYVKSSEEPGNSGLLNRPLTLQASNVPTGNGPGEQIPHLIQGHIYSVKDLIKQMIVYSDNDALHTLVANTDDNTFKQLNEIFGDLQIPLPTSQGIEVANFMTVEQYTRVFRVLRGATYLSRSDSEEALDLLAHADYKGGLVAGVPSNVVVSHKFGISPGTKDGDPELHDCGLVYYPKHTYLLCVMTRGSDYQSLEETIKELSAKTYQYMLTRYPDGAN